MEQGWPKECIKKINASYAKELSDKIEEYCLNDVIATETLWKHLQILADSKERMKNATRLD